MGPWNSAIGPRILKLFCSRGMGAGDDGRFGPRWMSNRCEDLDRFEGLLRLEY